MGPRCLRLPPDIWSPTPLRVTRALWKWPPLCSASGPRQLPLTRWWSPLPALALFAHKTLRCNGVGPAYFLVGRTEDGRAPGLRTAYPFQPRPWEFAAPSPFPPLLPRADSALLAFPQQTQRHPSTPSSRSPSSGFSPMPGQDEHSISPQRLFAPPLPLSVVQYVCLHCCLLYWTDTFPKAERTMLVVAMWAKDTGVGAEEPRTRLRQAMAMGLVP